MSHWQSFISTAEKAPLLNRQQSGNPMSISPIADYVLLKVTGPDAHTFLQGQCTCDFRRLTDSAWLLGAHCNPKGRMISSFLSVSLGENNIALKVHKDIAPVSANALNKYIVFSKADISQAGLQAVGLNFDSNTLPIVENWLSTLPLPGYSKRLDGGDTLLRLSENRAELWLSEDSTLLQQRPEQTIITPAQQWVLEQILSGVAEVRAHSSEQLLPQELNFQLLEGVSFDKGCYTGQEVIARMHYKATLKKHLYLAATTEPVEFSPAYGTAILASNKKTGHIICSEKDGENIAHCLALVEDRATEQDDVQLDGQNKVKLQWRQLPYAIHKG